MSWQSVSFLTDASHAEPVCDALLEAGALSASIEDADAGTPDEQPQFGELGCQLLPKYNQSNGCLRVGAKTPDWVEFFPNDKIFLSSFLEMISLGIL